VDAAAELVEVDLDPLDPARLGEHAGLGLDPRGHEQAPGGGEAAVAVEALLVSEELLDSGDLAHSLHLHHHRGALAVAAEQVDGPDVGGVLAPHQRHPLPERRDPGREQLLELGLHAVLLEARVDAVEPRCGDSASSIRCVSPLGLVAVITPALGIVQGGLQFSAL